VLFYAAALCVAGLLSEDGTIEISTNSAVNFVVGASITAGFAFGCYLAIRARANTLAHYSVVIAGLAQALAAGVWGQRYLEQMKQPDLSLGQALGLSIGGILMFGIALIAAIAALGAICGRVAYALTGQASEKPAG
jgi:hypothetical protein